MRWCASPARPRSSPPAVAIVAVAVGLLVGGAAWSEPPGPVRVPVVYPKGGCQSGWLEVQVYDAAAERWQPHPEHPRVRVGSCFREPSEILLTDLRVRCIDPSGRRPPSPWVQGTDLRGTDHRVDCKPGTSSPTPAKGGGGRR